MKFLESNFFKKTKALFDAYKMWVFFIALFGTNGAQLYVNSEPEPEAPEPVIEKPIAKPVENTVKKIVIYKTDNSYCEKLLEDHKTGSQH